VPADRPLGRLGEVVRWIMTSPDQLADADRVGLDAMLAVSTELAAVTASVRAFAAMMTGKQTCRWRS
jgi:hypothetical protein